MSQFPLILWPKIPHPCILLSRLVYLFGLQQLHELGTQLTFKWQFQCYGWLLSSGMCNFLYLHYHFLAWRLWCIILKTPSFFSSYGCYTCFLFWALVWEDRWNIIHQVDKTYFFVDIWSLAHGHVRMRGGELEETLAVHWRHIFTLHVYATSGSGEWLLA